MNESHILKDEFKNKLDNIFEDEIKIENQSLEETEDIKVLKTGELSQLQNIYDGCEVKEDTEIILERQRSVWDDDASDEIDNDEICTEINIFELIDKYSTQCSTCNTKVLARDENLLFCPKCNKTKIEEYICGICKTSMKLKGSLVSHMSTYHPEESHVKKDLSKYLFECDICNKRFSYKSSIERHIKSHNPSKPYKCDKCNKKFLREISLGKHLSVHRTNKRYSCIICSFHFDNEILCQIHIRRQHKYHELCESNKIEDLIKIDNKDSSGDGDDNEILNYICDVCSKIFYDKSSIAKHLTNKGHKIFSCTVCSKRFIKQSYLNKHMMNIHTEMKHTCNICNKSYTKHSSLQHHIKHSHDIARPFKCDYCNSSYVTNTQLKRHILGKHSQPQFFCDICNQCFRYNSSLKRHMIVHTGGFNYDCKYCNRYFMLKSTMMLHIKNKHSKEIKMLSKD